MMKLCSRGHHFQSLIFRARVQVAFLGSRVLSAVYLLSSLDTTPETLEPSPLIPNGPLAPVLPHEPVLVCCPHFSRRPSSHFSFILQPWSWQLIPTPSYENQGSGCPASEVTEGFLNHSSCRFGIQTLWSPHLLLLPLLSFWAILMTEVLIKESVPTIVLNPDTKFLTGGSFCPCCSRRRQRTLPFPSGPLHPTMLPLLPLVAGLTQQASFNFLLWLLGTAFYFRLLYFSRPLASANLQASCTLLFRFIGCLHPPGHPCWSFPPQVYWFLTGARVCGAPGTSVLSIYLVPQALLYSQPLLWTSHECSFSGP